MATTKKNNEKKEDASGGDGEDEDGDGDSDDDEVGWCRLTLSNPS